MNSSLQFQTSITCGACNQIINSCDTYIEFDDTFYHEQCYRCQYCCVSFATQQLDINNIETLHCMIPIKDKNNKLFCFNDLIRSLKCHICSLNFEQTSQVFRLNELAGPSQEEILAHVECVACKLCSKKLNTYSEFILEENERSVTCKECSLFKNKKTPTKRMNSHRLSSRQKEILESKFLQNKYMQNEKLTENNVFVCSLAKEVGCTRKSLVNFLVKQQDKLKENSLSTRVNLAKDNILKNQAIDMMLEELRKIDRVLAPNQCPFGQSNSHKSVFVKS